MKREPGLTRRAVLLGTLAVPLAGCRPRHPHRPAVTADNPDRVALLEALGLEQQLLGIGEGGLSRDDPDVIAHTEHVAALEAALGRPGTTSPQPSVTPAVGRRRRAGFDAAVTATVPRLRSLAVSAERGSTAAVLASIAANHGAPPPIRFRGQWYGARS